MAVYCFLTQSTIRFSFKKPAYTTADRNRKPKITALCCTPPIHSPLKLNPSITHGYWILN